MKKSPRNEECRLERATVRSESVRIISPQGRMTDHRIGLTLYRLEDLLNGNLEEVFEALATSEQLKKLAAKTMEDTEEQ